MDKYLAMLLSVIIISITCYGIADRICNSIDHGNTSALGFRALELGYDGKLDVDKLLGGG